MRRILIDKAVEERAKEFAEVMKGNRPDKLDWGEGKTPKERLVAFHKELVAFPENAEMASYLYTIISNCSVNPVIAV